MRNNSGIANYSEMPIPTTDQVHNTIKRLRFRIELSKFLAEGRAEAL